MADAEDRLPAGYIRVSRSWSPASFDTVLSTVRLKEVLGEFAYRPSGGDSIEMEPAWVAANIRTEVLPILGAWTCNAAALGALHGALGELQETGLVHLINVGDTRRNGGCYQPREIRGPSGGAISRHGWGLAIDVNPSSNRWGATPQIDARVVDVFRRWGFAWGGTWTRPDGMHFEWVDDG